MKVGDPAAGGGGPREMGEALGGMWGLRCPGEMGRSGAEGYPGPQPSERGAAGEELQGARGGRGAEGPPAGHRRRRLRRCFWRVRGILDAGASQKRVGEMVLPEGSGQQSQTQERSVMPRLPGVHRFGNKEALERAASVTKGRWVGGKGSPRTWLGSQAEDG